MVIRKTKYFGISPVLILDYLTATIVTKNSSKIGSYYFHPKAI